MNRSVRLLLFGAVLALPVACRTAASSDTTTPTENLTEGGEAQLEPVTLCDAADWRAAALCSDATCKAKALGQPCVNGIRELAECSGDACDEVCVDTLGDARCGFEENRTIASQLATVAGGKTAKELHVGMRPVMRLHGTAPDGKTFVVDDTVPRRRFGGDIVVTEADEILWRFPDPAENEACQSPFVSPAGAWVARACGKTVRVRELQSGFVRARFELAEKVMVRSGRDGKALTAKSFGGDRYLLLKGASGWQRHDLQESESLDLGMIPEKTPPAMVAISADGERLARAEIRSIVLHDLSSETNDVTIELDNEPRDIAWGEDSTIVTLGWDVIRRYDPSGRQVNERPIEQAQFDIGNRCLLADQGAVSLVEPSAKFVEVSAPFDDQRSVRLEPLPDWMPSLKAWGHSPSLALVNGVVALDDGGYATGSPTFGVTVFDVAGAPVDSGRGRGPLQWMAPDGDEHVLVAHPGGVRRWNIDTGEAELLDIPAEYAQRPLHRLDGGFVGLEVEEVKDGFMNLGPDLVPTGNVVIFREGELTRQELGANPLDLFRSKSGTVHVATEKGFFTRAPGEGQPLVEQRAVEEKTSKQAPPIEESEGPDSGQKDFMMGMVAAGVALTHAPPALEFSDDGELALMTSGGKLEVVRTDDYSKEAFEMEAQSCTFGPNEKIVCVVEPELEVWEIQKLDLSGDVVEKAEFLNLAGARKELMQLYGVDNEAEVDDAVGLLATLFRSFGVHSVSSDGQHVIVGPDDTAAAGFSFDRDTGWKPPSPESVLVGEHLLSTDGHALRIQKPADLPTVNLSKALLSN